MSGQTGVLLVNLGTPASAAPKDVYRYLLEFLTDSRVIDEPWLKRQLLVRGLIVPLRYRQSAASYRAIWTKEGSPLMIHSRAVQGLLQEALGNSFAVELAMRYQEPSLQKGLDALLAKEIAHLVVLPLFPQYASATTGSVCQRIMEILARKKAFPKITFINSYADYPLLIEAFYQVSASKNWRDYDHTLISFHGLPLRQLMPDSQLCYMAQCEQTTKALVSRLGLPEGRYTQCFQSRLGKQPWIQPYTSDCIKMCAQKGYKKVLVFCPSFVCDCLETIHEIGVEYAEEFKEYGGSQLDLVEGLNAHPAWIGALQQLVYDHLPRKELHLALSPMAAKAHEG